MGRVSWKRVYISATSINQLSGIAAKTKPTIYFEGGAKPPLEYRQLEKQGKVRVQREREKRKGRERERERERGRQRDRERERERKREYID